MLDVLAKAKADESDICATSVRIERAALDESEVRGGSVVLRGRISVGSLHRIRVDKEYQRPLETRGDIFDAFRAGKILPDVVLGCRGGSFKQDGDDIILTAPTYVIDGWQRIGNALRLLELINDIEVRLGCLVHFDTTPEFEALLFTALNRNQKKVSPNLHLRNCRSQSHAVLTLYGLSENDKNFVLRKRVCWAQNMARNHLITSMVMAKVAKQLHAHIGSSHGSNVEAIAAGLDAVCEIIGLQTFRQNMASLFMLIEECWGIRTIEFRKSAPQVKSAFLYTLAQVLSRHRNFWTGDKLQHLRVTSEMKSKLRSFPIQDPQVVNLAGQAGTSSKILYTMLVDHINKGRREHKLQSRYESKLKVHRESET